MILPPARAATGPLGRIPALLLTLTLTLALVLAGGMRPAGAQSDFPNIPVWSFPGAWHSDRDPNPSIADTITLRPRTLTVRWLRDSTAEAQPKFGGYRIYRATSIRDTTTMVLLRRFSRQADDSLFTWHFPTLLGTAPGDSQRIATFIDPDSSGRFVKVCRLRRPQEDPNGVCLSLRDSVMILIPPPGPHEGFRTWYSITYEVLNTTDNDYADAFVPDTRDGLARCGVTHTSPDSCPNLNHKAANLSNDVWEPREASAEPDSHFFARATEPTPGPRADLGVVRVVPNPYRATEAWNPGGGHEIHFINLPSQARIRIYTIAGDLVRELHHADPVRDFERWDLKNEAGRDITSGIYMYRVEAGRFIHQSRFVVIR